MDYREPRPPRSANPRGTPSVSPPSYSYPDSGFDRPPAQPISSPRGNVSFQTTERGDRHDPLDDNRQRYLSAYRDGPLPPTPSDMLKIEDGQEYDSRVGRKKSLVRPDREKIEPGHRQWHYRTHAAQLEDEGKGRMGLLPSSESLIYFVLKRERCSLLAATGSAPQRAPLRRGKSLLGRDQDIAESGLALFKRSATLRRRQSKATLQSDVDGDRHNDRSCLPDIPGPKDPWMIYCYVLTICIPGFLLKTFGA